MVFQAVEWCTGWYYIGIYWTEPYHLASWFSYLVTTPPLIFLLWTWMGLINFLPICPSCLHICFIILLNMILYFFLRIVHDFLDSNLSNLPDNIWWHTFLMLPYFFPDSTYVIQCPGGLTHRNQLYPYWIFFAEYFYLIYQLGSLYLVLMLFLQLF